MISSLSLSCLCNNIHMHYHHNNNTYKLKPVFKVLCVLHPTGTNPSCRHYLHCQLCQYITFVWKEKTISLLFPLTECHIVKDSLKVLLLLSLQSSGYLLRSMCVAETSRQIRKHHITSHSCTIFPFLKSLHRHLLSFQEIICMVAFFLSRSWEKYEKPVKNETILLPLVL